MKKANVDSAASGRKGNAEAMDDSLFAFGTKHNDSSSLLCSFCFFFLSLSLFFFFFFFFFFSLLLLACLLLVCLTVCFFSFSFSLSLCRLRRADEGARGKAVEEGSQILQKGQNKTHTSSLSISLLSFFLSLLFPPPFVLSFVPLFFFS